MAYIRTLANLDLWFFLFAAYLITKGILRREDAFLTAESGLGYTLGIVGGSMMLALLLYPLRKHVKWLRMLGPIRYWFRIHMLLGVAGPVLVLYHANFSLGSTNSNIALICMLVVAGSGLFGRLFYRKIHDGLYGRKLELGEMRQSLQLLKEQLDHAELHASIESLEQAALRHRPLPLAVLQMPLLRLRTRRTRRQVKQMLHTLLKQGADRAQLANAAHYLRQYFTMIPRVADFSVYERLFSLWHVLHIPLFIMMIISGVIHVFAVHIY